MTGSILGTQVRRIEDPDLIEGRGTFVDNLPDAGLAQAVFVRSPLAHAGIAGIDTSEAEAAPGVLAVYTAEDLGTDPLPAFAKVHDEAQRSALAHGKVRFVGDPVAVVVAETRRQAVDAAELVDVDYDPLDAVADVEAALEPKAPLQFEQIGSNIAAARFGSDDDALADAARVVRLRLVNQRIATAPIEGHAIVVAPGRPDGEGQGEGEGEGVTVHVSTQHPHLSRDLLAKTLGLAKDDVHVIAPHVGGAFGGKAAVFSDHGAIALTARKLGRAVKWVETRSEAMISMQGRGQVQYAELGLDDDGVITGLRLHIVGECGAYAGFGGSFAVGPTYTMATGPYRVPKLQYAGLGVMTNTAPVGAFRGAGRPEAAALLERLLDLAALETGLAPEELRRRNLLRPDDFPYETLTGASYDSGDYDLPLREALRVADVEAARAEQAARRERGDVRQLGIGIATYVEITGFGGSEYGSVAVQPDGTATVMSGTSAHGQGHGTSFAMLASDALGLPLERISYVQSDTRLVRSGGGTGGSRSLQLGGNAVRAAATELHDKARAVAARMLEAGVDDVALDRDSDEPAFTVAGVPQARVTWPEVAAYAHEHDGGLGVELDKEQHGATFPFGAHVSIVEVDTETGHVRPLRHIAVDDCGRVINPLVVAGQQHGGAVQGISQALWEHFVYDADGTPMTSTFADYWMPTTADTITLETSNTETPTPRNDLGVKGIGESATIGSTPAVQNAVVDALSHLGVKHVDLPCSPQTVWRALQSPDADPWREPPAAFAAEKRRRAESGDESEAVNVEA